jgi:hypothetical protein
MSEPAEARKPWRVIFGVLANDLERVLNAFSNDGYQLYRMDLIETHYESGGVSASGKSYDLVFFNAAIVASKAQESLMREGGQLQSLLTQLAQKGPPTPDTRG